MSGTLRRAAVSLFIVLAWGCGWLMLWTLGFHLTHSGLQAALFLPHGVCLALLILLPRRYWPALALTPTEVLLFNLFLTSFRVSSFIKGTNSALALNKQ
jgi:glucose-6-phosphate-specific signal transduction histidine kinase